MGVPQSGGRGAETHTRRSARPSSPGEWRWGHLRAGSGTPPYMHRVQGHGKGKLPLRSPDPAMFPAAFQEGPLTKQHKALHLLPGLLKCFT